MSSVVFSTFHVTVTVCVVMFPEILINLMLTELPSKHFLYFTMECEQRSINYAASALVTVQTVLIWENPPFWKTVGLQVAEGNGADAKQAGKQLFPNDATEKRDRLFVFGSKSDWTLGKSALEIGFMFGFLPLPAWICPLKLWTLEQNLELPFPPHRSVMEVKIWRLICTNCTLLLRVSCSCGGKEAFHLDDQSSSPVCSAALYIGCKLWWKKKALCCFFFLRNCCFFIDPFFLVHLFLCVHNFKENFDLIKYFEPKMSINKTNVKVEALPKGKLL